jgi:hypothetical protein
MKKLLLVLSIAGLALLAKAQQPAARIYGVSPGIDDLYYTDTTTWASSAAIQVVITNSTNAGMTGMAFDPTTYKSYVIAKIGFSRYLAEINLATGSATVVGDLGDNFSSIVFDETGQLYGASGDGANVPEGFFIINKATATNTLLFTMGNGNDGEVIGYNRFDDKIYHWSGNGAQVYESWPITNTTYAPTNINMSGNVNGEIFGAVNIDANQFLLSNIGSEYQYASTTGLLGTGVSINPDVFRGVIMPPRFAVSPSTLCASSGTVGLYSVSLQLYDSVYYHWGDGNMTQLPAASSSTAATVHSYTNAGTYTINVQLYNGVVAKSTFTTFVIQVSTTPSVTISGGGSICPGQSVTLSGSSGGSSQWYLNGSPIPGATQITYVATSPGWYNMLKTNLSGCSDSAAVGIQVTAAAGPTITVNSGTICSGSSFVITPSGANTYTITGGTATVNPVTTSNYSVVGSDVSGCLSNTVVATVTVNPIPSLTLSTSQPTICAGATAVLSASGASQYQWQFGGTTNTLSVSPAVTTTYVVSGISAGCSATMSIVQNVNECIGIAEKTTISTLHVMPNPSKGLFYVDNVVGHSRVEVLNALGQSVLTTTAAKSETIVLDLSGQSAGVYFVRVSANGIVAGQARIIKE